jgi:hypothetical protein
MYLLANVPLLRSKVICNFCIHKSGHFYYQIRQVHVISMLIEQRANVVVQDDL